MELRHSRLAVRCTPLANILWQQAPMPRETFTPAVLRYVEDPSVHHVPAPLSKNVYDIPPHDATPSRNGSRRSLTHNRMPHQIIIARLSTGDLAYVSSFSIDILRSTAIDLPLFAQGQSLLTASFRRRAKLL